MRRFHGGGGPPSSMLDEMLFKFRVARVAATLEVGADGRAPVFPGAAFRGALGRALRRVSCSTGYPSCHGCPLTARCAYGYLFETHVPQSAARMRLYPFAPHPMVLRPPDDCAEWRAGDLVHLELLLFGRGIDYLPFVLYALGVAGEDGIGPDRVPLRLVRADLVGASPRPLYDGATLAPGPYGVPLGREVARSAAGDVRLALLAPVRIVHEGNLARELPLHVLARALLRRAASLAYFHEGLTLDLDFAGIIERARSVPVRDARLSWRDQRRHSARQGRAQVLGGAVGDVTYVGVPADIAELLSLGELTHVGKGTAFGLGRYERRAA